jgi:putative transposase
MDFVHDTLSDGRAVRVLTIVDVYSRECVALEAAVGFRAADVARVLTDAGERRGKLPTVISVDNGTEFTSRDLDHWAYWNRVRRDFSRPGRPTDNPFLEAFNGSLRRECLSQDWFLDLDDARRTLQGWRGEHNNVKPHRSLADQAAARFGRGGHFIPGPNRFGFLNRLVAYDKGSGHYSEESENTRVSFRVSRQGDLERNSLDHRLTTPLSKRTVRGRFSPRRRRG